MLTHEVEHDIATLQGVLWIDEGVIEGGSLEHPHEDGSILWRQVLGLAVEIGLTGRLDAKGIGAEIHRVGILCQDLVLGEEELKLIGRDPLLALHDEHLQPRDVTQQTCGVLTSCTEEVLGELLGDGGGTTGITVEDIFLQDSGKGCIVDAVM